MLDPLLTFFLSVLPLGRFTPPFLLVTIVIEKESEGESKNVRCAKLDQFNYTIKLIPCV